MCKVRIVATMVAAQLAGTAAMAATPASDLGRAFDPQLRSPALYGIGAPSPDTPKQRHVIVAADGVELFMETWLPTAKDGRVPPQRHPTILIVGDPYSRPGYVLPGGAQDRLLKALVPRGYAFTRVHARGSGASGGCIDHAGALDATDGVAAMKFVVNDAGWANGNIGLYGLSYWGARH